MNEKAKSLTPADIVLWHDYELPEDIHGGVIYFINYSTNIGVPFGVVVLSKEIKEDLSDLVNIPFNDFAEIVEDVRGVNSHFLGIIADNIEMARKLQQEKSNEKSTES